MNYWHQNKVIECSCIILYTSQIIITRQFRFISPFQKCITEIDKAKFTSHKIAIVAYQQLISLGKKDNKIIYLYLWLLISSISKHLLKCQFYTVSILYLRYIKDNRDTERYRTASSPKIIILIIKNKLHRLNLYHVID